MMWKKGFSTISAEAAQDSDVDESFASYRLLFSLFILLLTLLHFPLPALIPALRC